MSMHTDLLAKAVLAAFFGVASAAATANAIVREIDREGRFTVPF